MANSKQTPPGLNAGNVYMKAVSGLADIFDASEQAPFQDPRMAGIEQADKWLQREVTSDISPVVAFKKGGLVGRTDTNKNKKPAPKLRADQEAFLDILKKRREYRQNKGKS